MSDQSKEVERYYQGMLNWKCTAEAKDKEIIALRAEVDSLKNADISSWVERDFTNQQTIASLKEKYEIALNRIANFEDMRDEYKQQLASLKERNALLTVQVQRLETAIAPLAKCHLPPDGCENLGVTAHFYTGEVVAAKAALTALPEADKEKS